MSLKSGGVVLIKGALERCGSHQKRQKHQKCKKSKLSRFVLVLLFALFVMFTSCVSRAYADSDFTYNMRSMIQLSPDFSTYAEPDGRGPDGIVWLKRVHLGMSPGGGVERQTMWILLGRRGLSPRWLSWNVPVPNGGDVEFLQASIYSPEEGVEIGTTVPVNSFDGTVRSVTFSDTPEEFILVVHYRETFPEKLYIDDIVWVSETIPVWETNIRVTAPAGHPFYYSSSQNSAPRVVRVADRMVYEWLIINTAAEINSSMRVTGREYVTFGSRAGQRAAALLVRAAERVPVPPPPQVVRNMLGRRQRDRAVNEVLNWLHEQPGIVLTSETRDVPAEAPWTNREKVLLAHNWLTEAGIDANLSWRLPYSPDDGVPISEGAIVNPVLGVSLPDSRGEIFYFDTELPPRAGGNEISLGGVVYALRETGIGLEERRQDPQRAAGNRLSARFDLNLNEDGILMGTIQIAARNAWRYFLFPEEPTSDDLASFLSSMFIQVPRHSDVTFSESGTESIVTVTLSGSQMIIGTEGSHVMASLPPMVPGWFRDLTSGPFPYNLRFPFVLDVSVTLTLPDAANMLLPSQTPQSSGRIRYSESLRIDRRRRFTAEAQMTVDATLISNEEASDLNSAIWNWYSFMTRNLPIQLRVR